MENKNQQINPLDSLPTPVEPVVELPKHKFITKKWLILVLGLFILSVLGTLSSSYLLYSNKQVACTNEAKLCPDGKTYVGRTGLKCEFAKCPIMTPPTITDPTANWKTYTDQKHGFTIQYPSKGIISHDENAIWLPEESSPTTNINFVNGFHADIRIFENMKYETAKQFVQDYWNPNVGTGADGKILNDVEKFTFENKTINGNFVTTISGLTVITGEGAPAAWINRGNYKIFIQAHTGINPILPDEQIQKQLESLLSTFKFTDQTPPTPTCKPRPACLDATPRCMIAETSDMCPKSTPTPTLGTKPHTGTGCKVGGCSGEVCQDANSELIASTCIYKASFACYKTARCEKQTNGKCGWTLNSELKSCLENTN